MSLLEEPLSQAEAKEIIGEIIRTGNVRYSRHAEERMLERDLRAIDCINVLRAGWVEPPECENGSWRYKTCTNQIWVVVAFRSRTSLVIVSAGRFAP